MRTLRSTGVYGFDLSPQSTRWRRLTFAVLQPSTKHTFSYELKDLNITPVIAKHHHTLKKDTFLSVNLKINLRAFGQATIAKKKLLQKPLPLNWRAPVQLISGAAFPKKYCLIELPRQKILSWTSCTSDWLHIQRNWRGKLVGNIERCFLFFKPGRKNRLVTCLLCIIWCCVCGL